MRGERDARIAAELPDARDAGQHLAADRALAGELPRRLHPADAPFAETPLRQIVRSVRPPSAAQQKRPFAAAVTPERKGLARQPPVQSLGDLDAVVAVVRAVGDAFVEFLPGMPPRRADEPEALRGARRIAEGEVESGQDRSEEQTSELQSLMRNSYAVFFLQKKKNMK